MNATTIRVGRLHRRLKLCRPIDSSAIDRATSRLAEALPAALDNHSISGVSAGRATTTSHGHLCVRELSIAMRIPASRLNDDAYVAASWATQIVGTLEQMVRPSIDATGSQIHDRGVVFYRNDADAVLDVAVSIARHDFRRAWAWQQLGLCGTAELSGGDISNAMSEGASNSTSIVVTALRAHPLLVVPVLTRLAEQELLSAFRFSPTQWALLARSAREALPVRQPSAESPQLIRRIERAVERSPLSQLASNLTNATAAERRAIAMLILAASAPELAADGTAVTILETRDLAEFTSQSRIANQDNRNLASETDVSEPKSEQIDRHVDTSLTSSTSTRDTNAEQDDTGSAGQLVSEAQDGEGAPTGIASSERTRGTSENMGDPEDNQRSTWSGYGGLLFLHNLQMLRQLESELPDALAARPLREVLFALAIRLTGASADDPAVLAFVGSAAADTWMAGDFDDDERAAIGDLADRILDELAIRLVRCEVPREQLISFVTRRTARVTAGPGWITIELSVDDVNIDLRASGLDLDPCHVPLIGCVIVFSYVAFAFDPVRSERERGGER